MTGSRPEDNNHVPDEELDPTGVRHLLANLPDPGPMPEHLTARIAESLQLEQQRRVGGGSPTGQEPHQVAGPAPISLAEERQRRRPGRNLAWLGSAAAVAVAATVATSQILGGGGDSDVAAQYPQNSANDAAEDAGQEEADQDDAAGDEGAPPAQDAAPAPPEDQEDGGAAEGDSDQEEPPSSMWPGRGDDAADAGDAGEVSSRVTVHTVTGSVHLTQDDLAAEVRTWAEAPMLGDTTWTAEQVTTCITESGVDSASFVDILASEAVLDGQAALLLVTTDGTPNAAWVLDDNCSQVLAGPVRLD